ncbi:MAG: hypothetical protein K2N05_03035 [Muribaculaceae bacterium]|nr:hypothetical protein [Muribaculaceae bacterium]
MKLNLKRFVCTIAAMAMLCIFCASASAQSQGLMKALNVKGQAKSISYDDWLFSFNKSGKSSDASNNNGITTLGCYAPHSEFEIEVKNNRMVKIGEYSQGGGWYIEFTAYDSNNRPIKGNLYSGDELSKRGAKISYSGADAKGNWTKMIIDKSGARGGEPSWIPSSIKRTIKYW